MNRITKAQLRMIFALKTSLCMSDVDLMEALYRIEGHADIVKLSYENAQSLIEKWQDIAVVIGVWEKQINHKFDHLADRPGFASPTQLRMIESLWDIYINEVANRNNTTTNLCTDLMIWLKDNWSIHHIEWVKSQIATNIIKSLKKMTSKIKGTKNSEIVTRSQGRMACPSKKGNGQQKQA